MNKKYFLLLVLSIAFISAILLTRKKETSFGRLKMRTGRRWQLEGATAARIRNKAT